MDGIHHGPRRTSRGNLRLALYNVRAAVLQSPRHAVDAAAHLRQSDRRAARISPNRTMESGLRWLALRRRDHRRARRAVLTFDLARRRRSLSLRAGPYARFGRGTASEQGFWRVFGRGGHTRGALRERQAPGPHRTE